MKKMGVRCVRQRRDDDMDASELFTEMRDASTRKRILRTQR
jgi:hypothetical protein